MWLFLLSTPHSLNTAVRITDYLKSLLSPLPPTSLFLLSLVIYISNINNECRFKIQPEQFDDIYLNKIDLYFQVIFI